MDRNIILKQKEEEKTIENKIFILKFKQKKNPHKYLIIVLLLKTNKKKTNTTSSNNKRKIKTKETSVFI